MFGRDVVADMVASAERIERESNGRAITQEEADTLKAVAFLRKIAPYAFEPAKVTAPSGD
jgi:plastocyanin